MQSENRVAGIAGYSVVWRLILSLTVAVSVVALLVSITLAYVITGKGKADLEQEADESVFHLSTILQKPLWDLDEKRTAIIGEAFSRDEWIVLLAIHGAREEELFSCKRGNVTDCVERSCDIIFEGRTLGSVHVAYSQEAYRRSVRQVLFATAISYVLIMLTIFGATGFLVRAYSRRPLGQLTDIVDSYAVEDDTAAARQIPYRELQPFSKVLPQVGEKVVGQLKALRENREQLNLALEASKQGWWEWDVRTGETTYSPQWYRMLGYEPNEFPATFDEWKNRLHPDDFTGVEAFLREHVFEQKTDFRNLEFRIQKKDGGWRWLAGHGKIVEWDESGNAVRVIGTNEDIDDTKRSKEERNLLFTAIEQAGEAVLITDRDGVIQYVNPSFETMTGFSPEEAVGQKPSILRSDQHDDAFFDEIWKTILEGWNWSGLITNRKKNGDLYDENNSISPVRRQDGTITHFVAVKRDVTEEQQLEQRLNQAQKMEAIGTLAGGVAHDFNNILGGIIGFADLGTRSVDKDSRAAMAFGEILGASERSAGLVKQILTFARRADRQKEVVQVSGVVKEVLKLIRASLPTTIEILDNIESNAKVLANPTELHQVMMNLCTNAKLAMPDGGTLDVTLTTLDVDRDFAHIHEGLQPGPHVQLTVSDTGVGMAKQVLFRIFDPFFTTRGKGEGTGMGLSVVHGVVAECGGAVLVHSEPGKGTSFKVILPIADGQEGEESASCDEIPEGHETILLVDDEQALVNCGTMLLADIGYAVIGFTSSEKAFDTFKANPETFDLVLADTTMPQMTGDVLLQKVREIRPDIPFILCSGFSERINREQAESIGADAFLMKPLVLRTLAEAVRHAIDLPR